MIGQTLLDQTEPGGIDAWKLDARQFLLKLFVEIRRGMGGSLATQRARSDCSLGFVMDLKGASLAPNPAFVNFFGGAESGHCVSFVAEMLEGGFLEPSWVFTDSFSTALALVA